VRTPSLIFEWPSRHRIHLFLPFAVLVAALLHAAIFFLFSVKHPPPKSGSTNTARLYFLSSTSPGASRIESALHSSDPALFAPGRGLPEPAEWPTSTYTPQFAKDTTSWDVPPLRIQKPRIDRTVQGPVKIPRKRPSLGATHAAPGTRLRASEDIAPRLPGTPAMPKFHTRSSTQPEEAIFLIAISPEGQVLHAFTDKSSGDNLLDREALAYLRKLQFSPSQKNVPDWGFVEFQWGSEVLPSTMP